MSNKRNNRKKLTAVSIVAIAVIGFTDGEDNSSQNSPDDVISLANSLGVPVYIIGTGSFDTSALEEIANSTNGRYWDADTINDVGDI
ncbi:MAG: VWA domain-containing protein [Candidatus Weimeria sp.]